MLHLLSSKPKNPASGRVFPEFIDLSVLHGNPARIISPGSAQATEAAV
jgi:hypothetical protein